MISITCISDLHGFLPSLPGGDLLLVAGDLIAQDTIEDYQRFKQWLNMVDYRCKIVISGNHDGLLDCGYPEGLLELGKVVIEDGSIGIHYLCDSGFEFEGVKIWGSPYTPRYLDWYFMRNRGKDIKKHWDLIPSDTEILVTHGPPYGIFDETDDQRHLGCQDLLEQVQKRIRPRIHCFGHIHEGGDSKKEIAGTTYINCSHLDKNYRPVNPPIIVNLTISNLREGEWKKSQVKNV